MLTGLVRLESEHPKRFKFNPFFSSAFIIILALMIIDLERSEDMMIGYFYILPVILCFFTDRPRMIYLVAAAATVASLIGLFFAPSGITDNITINRPFSLIVVWSVAVLGNHQVRANTKLAQERNRLRAILDTLPVGVAISDAKGRMDEANGQMDRIWGGRFVMTRDDNESLSYVGYWPGTGTRLRLDEWPMARSVNKGEVVSGEIVDIERYNGSRGTVLLYSAPIRDANGAVTGSVMIATDISEQQATEKELAEKAEDLARSNKELQQFAYVASHDLKEPLRMVTTYVQLLERKYGTELDDQAKEYIGFAVEGSKRMYALVDDLLTYSRVETSVQPFAAVDMGQVMRITLKDLSSTLESSGAALTMDDMPEVNADYQQMVQLMENLIGNAIKFRREETPTVHVSAELIGNDWMFSVKDNGIGIAMEYSGKVFQMFQRLHAREKFPGTGIGLAICKKVVERHGGRIWFESEPGVGTTFFFTIPKRTG